MSSSLSAIHRPVGYHVLLSCATAEKQGPQQVSTTMGFREEALSGWVPPSLLKITLVGVDIGPVSGCPAYIKPFV